MPKIVRRDDVHYLGIDPGQKGGLCLLHPDGMITTHHMPDTERDTWEIIKAIPTNVVAVIEKVGAMPMQGVTSTFTFGCGFGHLCGFLIAADISFEKIPPQNWQKYLGIVPRKKTETKPDFKNRLRAKAQELFPKLSVWKEGKGKQMAVCDALLIAEYCRRKHQRK